MKKIIYITFILFTACKQPQAVFDIPPLVGKSIDEVREVLGKPQQEPMDRIDSLSTYFYNSYKKNSFLLNIRFNPKNRKIYHFHIISNDDDFDKLEDILKIGNLDSTSTAYSIETDQSFNYFNNYTNVTIYPK